MTETIGFTKGIHEQGLEIIEMVRCLFSSCEGCLCTVNTLTDPRCALAVVVPLTAAVSTAAADALLLCLVATRLVIFLFRRVFMEARPLRASSSGTASSHCGSAAALLGLAATAANHASEGNDNMKYCVVAAYGAGLWATLIARVYSAEHYPHQCFLGAAAGLLVTWALRDQAGAVRELQPRLTAVAAVAGVFLLVLLLSGLSECEPSRKSRQQVGRRCPETCHRGDIQDLVTSLGYLLGWALSAGPHLDKYQMSSDNLKTAGMALAFAIFLIIFIELIDCVTPRSGFVAAAVAVTTRAAQTVLLLRIMPQVLVGK